MKKLSLFLALAMLASLASCGGEGTPSETTAASGDTTAPAVTADPNLPDIPEDVDFNGKEFTIYVNKPLYMFTDEENGDTLNDTVYARERKIEEQLGIDLVFHGENDSALVIQDLRKTVTSGDSEYQLMFTHMINSNAAMISENLILDWNLVPTVDFSKPYWNTSATNALKVNGKLPFVAGDANLAPMVLMAYNKQIADEYKLGSFYDAVDEGKWTFDMMYTAANTAASDLNGDSQYDENDRYGLSYQLEWPMISYMYAAGITVTSQNSAGVPELTLYNERTVDFIEGFHDFVNGGNTVFSDKAAAKPQKQFIDGKSLFVLEYTNTIEPYRDIKFDYGLLPLPKYDENQEKYLNNSWGGLMVIPSSVKSEELELVGYVSELLCHYGKTEVTPAYFETLMSNKIARDEDSIRMLEIIYDSENIVYDIGFNLTGFNNLLYSLPTSLIQGNSSYSSFYEMNESSVKGTLEDVLEAYEGFGE